MSDSFTCPQVIAHRGASYYAPENTKAAFELAAKQGAKWIEFDLRLTKDRNIVIIHNSTVTKRTNGKGKVIKMDYVDIVKLDAGSWHSQRYAGQRVLSLEKMINLIDKLDLQANFEIKAIPGLNAETAEVTAKIIKRCWPENKLLPLISSYSINAIEVSKDLLPDAPRALVVGEWNRHIANLVIDLDCVSINADRRLIDAQTLASMRDTGCKVLIHTVNGLNSAVKFIRMGVDGLFTDRPDVIIQKLQSEGLYRE